jgi:hypothetical protein
VRINVDGGYLWEVSPDGKSFIVALGGDEPDRPLTLVQNWTKRRTQ